VTSLAVYVTPKSGRDEIVGWRGAELHVRVTAPPEDGKANTAACKLIARELGVSKSSVRILRGGASRHKIVAIEGATEAQIGILRGGPAASS
jgi:uncharacterized protein (TIGR00251 family)